MNKIVIGVISLALVVVGIAFFMVSQKPSRPEVFESYPFDDTKRCPKCGALCSSGYDAKNFRYVEGPPERVEIRCADCKAIWNMLPKNSRPTEAHAK